MLNSALTDTTKSISNRAFWFPIILLDLILLISIAKITLVAALISTAVLCFVFIRRVEWLIGLMLLGLPLFDPLHLSSSESSFFILMLRALFLTGWLVAIHKRSDQTSTMIMGGERSGESTLKPALVNWCSLSLFLLTIWLWLGFGWSGSPSYGAGKAKSFLLSNSFFYLSAVTLWPLWARRTNLDRLIKSGILFGGLVVAAGVAVSLGLDHELLIGSVGGQFGQYEARLAWLGANAIWLARIMATWLILILWGVQRRIVPIVVGILAVIVSLGLIVSTGSRGPLIALLLSPLCLLFLPINRTPKQPPAPSKQANITSGRHRKLSARNLLLFVGLVCLLIVLLSLLLPADQRARLLSVVMRSPSADLLGSSDTSGGIIQTISNGLFSDSSSEFRRSLIETCLDQIRYSLPWGVGTGGFSHVVFLRDFRIYPHNIFFELLLENGLPGLVLFVLFLLLVWRRAWRLVRLGYSEVKWLWLLMSMMLLNAQVSGDLPLNAHIWFWGGLIVAAEIYCTRRGKTV